MLKTILKTFFKVFLAVVVVRVGIFAVGLNVAADASGRPSLTALPSMKELRAISRDGLETVSEILGR